MLNFTLERAMDSRSNSSTFSLSSALDGVEWSTPSPGCFTPRKRTHFPLYRRLGWPQRRSGRVQKLSLLLGFDPQIVQHIACRYTD